MEGTCFIMAAIRKQKTSLRDKILIVIFSIIIVISVLCVAGVFILNTSFLANTETPGTDGKLSEEVVTPVEIKDKYVNFLVVGIDYVKGSSRGQLTDVIMVVSYDVEGKNIDVLQVPRDTYVGNATTTGKINSVYGRSEDGGIEGIANMLFTTFNITIDHYVTLNMDGFTHIVDAIGGVEIDVPQRIELEGAILEPGLQTLTGWRAEKFVRERHSYPNGDLGRIDMQKVFMKAFIEKVFNMSKTEVVKLAPKIVKEITTDLTLAEMLGYYNKVTEVDRNTAINFYTAPVSGGGSYRGNSVVLLDAEECAALLNEHFRPYTRKIPAEELGIVTL